MKTYEPTESNMQRVSDQLVDIARQGGLGGITAIEAAADAIREMRDAKPGEQRVFYLGAARVVIKKNH